MEDLQSTLQLHGDINKKLLENVGKHFVSNNKCLIHHIDLDSDGGDYNTAVKIGKCMHHFPTRVIVTGKAESAAFLILQCCTERVAHKDAKILLHFPRFKSGEIKLSHLKVFRNFLEFLSRRTNHSVGFLWELASLEKTLTTQEALELRFIDTILP